MVTLSEMILALVALLTLSIVFTAAINRLPWLSVPLWGGVSAYDTPLWSIVSSLIPWLFTLLLFVNLYRLMFWIYLSSLITLFGAPLSAAVAQYPGNCRQDVS